MAVVPSDNHNIQLPNDSPEKSGLFVFSRPCKNIQVILSAWALSIALKISIPIACFVRSLIGHYQFFCLFMAVSFARSIALFWTAQRVELAGGTKEAAREAYRSLAGRTEFICAAFEALAFAEALWLLSRMMRQGSPVARLGAALSLAAGVASAGIAYVVGVRPFEWGTHYLAGLFVALAFSSAWWFSIRVTPNALRHAALFGLYVLVNLAAQRQKSSLLATLGSAAVMGLWIYAIRARGEALEPIHPEAETPAQFRAAIRAAGR